MKFKLDKALVEILLPANKFTNNPGIVQGNNGRLGGAHQNYCRYDLFTLKNTFCYKQAKEPEVPTIPDKNIGTLTFPNL